MSEAIFFRILTQLPEEKGGNLEELITEANDTQLNGYTWVFNPEDFQLVPETPFAYWFGAEIREKLRHYPLFEPEAGIVRVGLQTSDDPRFVRTIWEINPANLYFCYYPIDGSDYCRFDDPIIQAYLRRQQAGTMKWAFHVKGGSSQPWYSPLTMVVDWEGNASNLRSFVDDRGKQRSVLRSEDLYFRPGFSWTRRAVRLVPYIVPSNAIPTVSRYQAFPHSGSEFAAMVLAASNLATGLCRVYGEKFEWPNFLVEMIKALPWSEKLAVLKGEFEALVRTEVNRRRRIYAFIEPFQEFVHPSYISGQHETYLESLTYNQSTLLGHELELKIASEAYGLTADELFVIERDMLEAIEFQQKRPSPDDDADEDDAKLVFEYSPKAEMEALLQYAVGCVFGRWDIRMALNSELIPKPADPFDPLPVCPPGTLVGPDGLPANKDTIVSETWLRQRPNAITLPPDELGGNDVIPKEEYPLEVAWDGILVDDPTHPGDIVRRVRHVLVLLFPNRATFIENEICDLLGVKDIRDYFRDPRRGFFAFHIARYTQNRRKAPIYWLLQSANRSYSLWLYCHRLGEYSYLEASRSYVDAKINLERGRLQELQQGLAALQGTARKQHERQIGQQQKLVDELVSFGKTLDKIGVSKLPPDLNDGVLISIAPLHELVPWKEAEKTWHELVAGQYTWSTMSQQMARRNLILPVK